jgi:D-3-phosphoglycerate dehydrogenase
MKKNVLLIDTLHPSFKIKLEENGIECVEGYDWGRDETAGKIESFDGIAIRSRFKLDRSFLQKAKRVKCIGRAGAGMENIDLKAAEEFEIICLNAPEGNRDAVGEHAIGMLLALLNRLVIADREVRNGIWKREENRGIEIQGKVVGIFGFGNMGSAFGKKLRGFDCEIIAYDKYQRIDQQQYPFVKQVEMDELFERADILSLHVPLTPETSFLVNREFIAKFKKNIWLINTARGKVVNTEALVDAIQNGKVTGAALDVLEYESISFEQLDAAKLPLPFQYLIQSDKVVLSPHIGGWTHESNEKIATILADKMIAVLSIGNE